MANAVAARTEHIRRVASIGDIERCLGVQFHAVQWADRLPSRALAMVAGTWIAVAAPSWVT